MINAKQLGVTLSTADIIKRIDQIRSKLLKNGHNISRSKLAGTVFETKFNELTDEEIIRLVRK